MIPTLHHHHHLHQHHHHSAVTSLLSSMLMHWQSCSILRVLQQISRQHSCMVAYCCSISPIILFFIFLLLKCPLLCLMNVNFQNLVVSQKSEMSSQNTFCPNTYYLRNLDVGGPQYLSHSLHKPHFTRFQWCSYWHNSCFTST